MFQAFVEVLKLGPRGVVKQALVVGYVERLGSGVLQQDWSGANSLLHLLQGSAYLSQEYTWNATST